MKQIIKNCYRIVAIPLFSDNYSYIVEGTAQNRLVLVDPANPSIITQFLQSYYPHQIVTHILYTHKHWDHAGGSSEITSILKQRCQELQVLIGHEDKQFVEGTTKGLLGKQILNINNSKVNTIYAPCHTRGHVVYNFLPLSSEISQKNVQFKPIQGRNVNTFQSNNITFTGDTLFSGGIGKFFQGNALQMTNNIIEILDKIDQNSHIFNGHQYTLSNLQWAKEVEKQNQFLYQYWSKLEEKAKQIGKQHVCTLPTTLKLQKQINLFVRAVSGTPLHNTVQKNSAILMGILREMKNQNKTNFDKSHI